MMVSVDHGWILLWKSNTAWWRLREDCLSSPPFPPFLIAVAPDCRQWPHDMSVSSSSMRFWIRVGGLILSSGKNLFDIFAGPCTVEYDMEYNNMVQYHRIHYNITKAFEKGYRDAQSFIPFDIIMCYWSGALYYYVIERKRMNCDSSIWGLYEESVGIW